MDDGVHRFAKTSSKVDSFGGSYFANPGIFCGDVVYLSGALFSSFAWKAQHFLLSSVDGLSDPHDLFSAISHLHICRLVTCGSSI